MIIFMNGRHTFVEADTEPIVWVDSQDATTYTLSGNDVLTLDNKGTLGGAMTLNGTVKFANSGFESWSGSDYITRDLGETFLPTNSFTIATTFDFQNIAQQNNRGWWGSLYADVNNRVAHFRNTTSVNNQVIASGSTQIRGTLYNLALQTLVISYDVSTSSVIFLQEDGTNFTFNSLVFNNTINTFVWLLRAGITSTTSSGQNNPLHEFRLYDRAFTLTQMQNLQTELNNKYSTPIVWVDSSDATTYTLSGNDVLTLDNKGSLGGAMTLNGTVKFANSGFESWTVSDYITYSLGETFLPTNSFTIVTTYDLTTLTFPSNNRGTFSSVFSNTFNRVPIAIDNGDEYTTTVSSNVVNTKIITATLSLKTNVITYDLTTNEAILLSSDGTSIVKTSVVFNNVVNAVTYLLRAGASTTTSTGANNPLHEFRLYDRAMSLTQMQTLQTELNNKYTP